MNENLKVPAASIRRLTGLHGLTVTLIHADCLDVLPLACDAVVTDPPYGGGYAAKPIKENHASAEWDDSPCKNVLTLPGLAPLVVIWGGNYYALPPRRGWLVWQKPDRPPSMADAELAWVSRDMNTRVLPWTIAATNAERCGHPTQKPVRVMAWAMEQIGVLKGATVLDPYMGSGTTGIACIRTGRNFIGIEKDAKYFETACDRIAHELDGALI